jgi:predicted phosphodiesterase
MLHGGRGTIAALVVLCWSGHALAGRGLRKGPYLTGLSDEGVVVRFELPAPAAATVQVARDTTPSPLGSARTFESHELATMHEVPATGLESGAAYKYVVRSGGLTIGEGRFVTAPRSDSGAPLTFLVYGDSRTDPAAHSSVIHAMEQASSDFLVNTGDLVEDGSSDGDWQAFFDVEASLLRGRPLWSAIGNHEIHHDPAGVRFSRYLGFSDASGTLRPYGTVRVSNVRLFFLDSQHAWDAGDERQWLERELARADSETGVVWRIVVVHDGPWSAGPHGPSERLVQGRVPDLLAEHKVDLLFSGHDHTYQRGEAGPIKYIVSGGAGAPLYGITRSLTTTRKAVSAYHFVEVRTNAEQVQIVARRPDGAEIDRCGMRKGMAWDCDPPPAPPAPPPPPGPALPQPSPSRGGCDVAGAKGLAGGWGGPFWAGIALVSAPLVRGRRRRG